MQNIVQNPLFSDIYFSVLFGGNSSKPGILIQTLLYRNGHVLFQEGRFTVLLSGRETDSSSKKVVLSPPFALSVNVVLTQETKASFSKKKLTFLYLQF